MKSKSTSSNPLPFGYGDSRSRGVPHGFEQCAHCGRAVRPEVAHWVEVFGGGNRYAKVGEVIDSSDPGHMGMFAVGTDCAKRLAKAGVEVQPPSAIPKFLQK